MITRRAACFAVLIAAALGMPGCSGRHAQPAPQIKTIAVSYDELMNQKRITRSVTLSAGDTMRISLASNASTGYQWAPQLQISDGRVVAQTGHQSVTADGAPGSAGAEVWMLRAAAPGAATVTTSYGQPWPGGAKGSWTFTAEVTVR